MSASPAADSRNAPSSRPRSGEAVDGPSPPAEPFPSPLAAFDLTGEERHSLTLQGIAGHLAFAVVGPGAVFYMRRIRGNRIEGLETARRVYRQALSTGRPTIVCANHLTMFDSLYLLHAFGSTVDYLIDFRSFAWNVPAIENFSSNLLWRTVVYLGKCIPIDRAGDATHHKNVLDKLAYLAQRGEPCMIFPEGGRSRTGRVDVESVTYGVGKVLAALERPQVVCAYLRGDQQKSYSDMPARGDTLHLSAEVIEPRTSQTGLRAARDLSRQVAEKLRQMEERFFAERS
jgi:hypothetical protein